ncbi:MAG: trigger factor [Deltaproteobacteria bacterium RBG_19FT_COMBO_43_11]|nr:MAG: trigger factor [Deltaproteobacteria bacterium RBG_19FT_COMBO_43_11]
MSQVVINMEELSSVKKKVSFEIPWNEVKSELDTVYKEVGKKAKIKGFRQGKIPRKVLEMHYKEQAETETINNIINKFYWQTLEEKKIIALSRPDINQDGLKQNTNFSFSVSFETEPDFEPKGYKGMELEKEIISVTATDREKRINEIRQMFATMEEVVDERPVQKGDFVVIDFAGTYNGESPQELKSDNYLLEIGSQRFITGFEEQLIGMKKEETKTIKVVFPEDYHEKKFAGKEIAFEVTIKSLKEKKLPEFNEEFIKNFNKYNSLEDLKNDIQKSLEEESQRISEIKLQNRITELLLNENSFEAPPSLIERQIFYMMADTQRRMTSAGMDEKNALELSFNMHDKFKDDAAKIVKSFLLLKKIAQKESIVIEDSDAEKHIEELAVKYGKDYELLKKAYENEEKKENLKVEMVQKKVFDFIEQNANIKLTEKKGMDAEVK